MLFMVCPSCGEMLGNKELVYIEEMKKVCESLGIDDNTVSIAEIDTTEEYKKKKQAVIHKLLRNPCCIMRLMNYIDKVHLIKG